MDSRRARVRRAQRPLVSHRRRHRRTALDATIVALPPEGDKPRAETIGRGAGLDVDARARAPEPRAGATTKALVSRRRRTRPRGVCAVSALATRAAGYVEWIPLGLEPLAGTLLNPPITRVLHVTTCDER